MKTSGDFKMSDYLEKLNEEAEMKDNPTAKVPDEGMIIPDTNQKTYKWLKSEYQKGKVEVKVEMRLGTAKFEPGYSTKGASDFKPEIKSKSGSIKVEAKTTPKVKETLPKVEAKAIKKEPKKAIKEKEEEPKEEKTKVEESLKAKVKKLKGPYVVYFEKKLPNAGGWDLTNVVGGFEKAGEAREYGKKHLKKDQKYTACKIEAFKQIDFGKLNEGFNQGTTLYDMLQEMGTWFSVPQVALQAAKKSGINEDNHHEFAKLVMDWQDGRYDDDPDYLYNELLNLIGM
jgi:hypothetical protein